MSRSYAYMARRIAALPYESEARLAVLKLFRCYSLATALLLLDHADAARQADLEQALNEIFERAARS